MNDPKIGLVVPDAVPHEPREARALAAHDFDRLVKQMESVDHPCDLRQQVADALAQLDAMRAQVTQAEARQAALSDVLQHMKRYYQDAIAAVENAASPNVYAERVLEWRLVVTKVDLAVSTFSARVELTQKLLDAAKAQLKAADEMRACIAANDSSFVQVSVAADRYFAAAAKTGEVTRELIALDGGG